MDYVYKKLTHRLNPGKQGRWWIVYRAFGGLAHGTKVIVHEVGRHGGDKRMCIRLELVDAPGDVRIVDVPEELGIGKLFASGQPLLWQF